MQPMIIKYHNIKAELKRLGLTQREVAQHLGITTQALDKRIKADKPSIHLITYALAHVYGDPDQNNLTIEVAND